MFDDSNDHFDFSDFNSGHAMPEFDINDWNAENTFSPPWSQFNPDLIGGETTHISQTTGFTCAVVSQQMVLNDFGIPVSEAQLVYDATSNGWLNSGGTYPEDMSRLLNHYGVSTHANYNGDMPSLINELAHGHKVIVPVNSSELWDGVSFWQRLTGFHNTGADHAIVVSGVDFSDVDHPMVVVNDPGHPDGVTQQYPLEHFLEAWNDSNCTYIATDEAPAGLAQSAQLGAQFDDTTNIYMTKEFWIDTGIKIAGVALASIVQSYFSETMNSYDASFEPSLSWESLDDYSRNQLFYEI